MKTHCRPITACACGKNNEGFLPIHWPWYHDIVCMVIFALTGTKPLKCSIIES